LPTFAEIIVLSNKTDNGALKQGTFISWNLLKRRYRHHRDDSIKTNWLQPQLLYHQSIQVF